MDEAEAKAWIKATFDVPRETMERLDEFVSLLCADQQNLIASSTKARTWSRHIADSAQLLLHVERRSPWLDLGSGAGFPGLVVAALSHAEVTLVEPRRLRVSFLERAVSCLQLERSVTIVGTKIEAVPSKSFAIISARAFASLDQLLTLAERFSTEKTRWVLPKGRNARAELDAICGTWQGDFRLVPSVTDEDARIIVAQGVRRRDKGKRAR